MRVYVAGPWNNRDVAAEVAKKFEEAGHEITHKWWTHDAGVGGLANTEYHLKCAENDIKGVWMADVFYLLNLQERGQETSGKAVELGLALGMIRFADEQMRIFYEGPVTNVFQLLPEVEHVQNVEEAIGKL